MKQGLKIPLFLTLALALSSCASSVVYLKNDREERVRCEGKKEALDSCVKNYRNHGYKPEEEPLVPPGATDLSLSMESPY